MKTDPPPTPESDSRSTPESDTSLVPDSDPRYRRAARLLAQKLGVEWRSLPPEQVRDYLRKIEIAEAQAPRKPRP